MDSDTESSFEMVPDGLTVRESKTQKSKMETELKSVKNGLHVKESIDRIEQIMKKKTEKKMSKKQVIFQELVAFTLFTSSLLFICFFDLLEWNAGDQLLGGARKFDENFKMKVAEFIANLKMSGRLNRPVNTFENAALFYMLSEKQPIEVAFRREWIADGDRFEGVERFVRGMEWENTFEEELFVRGVPNFDHTFELAEMTLKTTMDGKNYNKKFLNLGRKEMIDKTHSIEYFTSQRSLIRMEKKNGKELSRSEYFLKFGDLHVLDRRGDLECTRVYYAPILEKDMKKRLQKK